MKRHDFLHKQVSRYIKLQYPNVVFTSDSSGVRVTKGQAITLKAMRSRHTQLDMCIFQPSTHYHGLFIEIKNNTSEAFTLKGSIKKHRRIEAQYRTIKKLRKLGYAACFGCGFDHCKNIIDAYMNDMSLEFLYLDVKFKL